MNDPERTADLDACMATIRRAVERYTADRVADAHFMWTTRTALRVCDDPADEAVRLAAALNIALRETP